ncbi:MAPEG family protein [Methylobacterium sp. J-072]|uniref:MAPEG family protein n=1 Tax=Methylobacterium sp. J-072 TaxID=2836651 RepID=UPI001FB873D9|nr:MAPEG family protein [Methylobacterium sp. J-072]MCJ2093453.1 MAPEG family protein [Methylobacterium sp. J-072]
MIFPATTAVYAALLALVYLGLSGWVMGSRVSDNVLFGDGGDESMLKRVRSHANFSEYVPLALILVGLLEAGGASHGLVQGLLIALLVGRILHPIGMFAAPNSPRQFACRGGGILLTLAVLAIAAIALLLRTA